MVRNISIYWYLYSSSTAVFLLTSLIHLWENPDGSVITRIFHNQESEFENCKILKIKRALLNRTIVCFRSHQCTMCLSVALRFWNNWKYKGLVFAQFWSKIYQSSSNWLWTTQIFNEKYRHSIFAKNLGDVGKKCEGGSVKVEIFGNDKWDHCQEKTSK